MSGILVKSRRAVHQATLFANELENDPHAQRFYGSIRCRYIDDLWNEYDERFAKGQPPAPKNPVYVYDPLRKEGLSREHPFVDALFKEALKRLRPLVEEERKQTESQQLQVENEQTRRRLNILEKAAAKFMNENLFEPEAARESTGDSEGTPYGRKGYVLSPPFTQIVFGHSVRFTISVKQEAFPEMSAGDTVEISPESSEISLTKRYGGLELHPNQEGVLRCQWLVKGEKPTKATGIKVRVGSNEYSAG